MLLLIKKERVVNYVQLHTHKLFCNCDENWNLEGEILSSPLYFAIPLAESSVLAVSLSNRFVRCASCFMLRASCVVLCARCFLHFAFCFLLFTSHFFLVAFWLGQWDLGWEG